ALALAAQFGQRVEAVLGKECKHRIIRDNAAGIQDVVADERDAVVARKEQRAALDLEEATERVVLAQRRQARLAEQRTRRGGVLGQEAADADRERRLVRQHAGVGGAVQR